MCSRPSVDGHRSNTLVRPGQIHRDGSKLEYSKLNPKIKQKMQIVVEVLKILQNLKLIKRKRWEYVNI